jgi:sulfite exporter TauE/SafE
MLDSDHDTDSAIAASRTSREESRRKRRLRLSLGMRVLTFAVGWGLLLVGVAGLALPGIQGVLTILLGVAVLSLASETAYRLLKRLLHRWPSVWNRIEHWRETVHDWLHREKSS